MELITAGTVLPGPAHERINDGAVLVEGNTIVEVGASEDLVSSDVGRRDFGRDAAIVPGLINCHVHLAFDTTEEWLQNLQASTDTDLLLGMAGRAQHALRCGVTSVRDLGDRGGLAIQLRDAIERGEIDGPRILSAGAPLTIPSGHCWFLGGEVAGETEIREHINNTARAGADLIKVMASGGQVTPNSPPSWKSQFTREELAFIVREARDCGLGVAAHAHGTNTIADCVAAGVTTIEHCSWEGPHGSSDLREDIAQDIVRHDVAVCHAWPSPWQPFAERMGSELTDVAMKRTAWMHEQGVLLVAGTDSGLPGSEIDVAGGLGFYGESGICPATSLAMATTDAAVALGHGDSLGRLAPGYAADLLVVDGDPHHDLASLEHRQFVMSRGQPITPS